MWRCSRWIKRFAAWCEIRRITAVCLCILLLDWGIAPAFLGSGYGATQLALSSLNPVATAFAGRFCRRGSTYVKVDGHWMPEHELSAAQQAALKPGETNVWIRSKDRVVCCGVFVPWLAFSPRVAGVHVYVAGEAAFAAKDQAEVFSAEDQTEVLKVYARYRLGDAKLAADLPDGAGLQVRVAWAGVAHDAVLLPMLVLVVFVWARRRAYGRLLAVIKMRDGTRPCVRCGYDRSGTMDRACPECGLGAGAA